MLKRLLLYESEKRGGCRNTICRDSLLSFFNPATRSFPPRNESGKWKDESGK